LNCPYFCTESRLVILIHFFEFTLCFVDVLCNIINQVGDGVRFATAGLPEGNDGPHAALDGVVDDGRAVVVEDLGSLGVVFLGTVELLCFGLGFVLALQGLFG
jgi:hypothetical protein